jgi:hypothetical protein
MLLRAAAFLFAGLRALPLRQKLGVDGSRHKIGPMARTAACARYHLRTD